MDSRRADQNSGEDALCKDQGTPSKAGSLRPSCSASARSEDTFFFTAAAPGPGPGVHIISKSEISPDSKVNKTDLGTQNIEGVAAQGTRVTRTIPAGTIGNDLPIVITTETWYSPELKVLVMSKTNDPRMGETTYKLTDIQRAEPAASLFQVPDDYTVSKRSALGNNFVYRVIKKNP